MKYLNKKNVKQYIASQGKRCSPSFLLWLDIKVEQILTKHIKALGQAKKTLNMEDAELLEKLLGKQ